MAGAVGAFEATFEGAFDVGFMGVLSADISQVLPCVGGRSFEVASGWADAALWEVGFAVVGTLSGVEVFLLLLLSLPAIYFR